ncbi:hypothetical protein M407DRAFT_33640 [Tulasnella calospora MUT 4182]|uniref:Condensation domain-containing protein n=1 Tax=Tulasnella calospora MUT 4182 TaxID=1051891 RepID=A0A0C3PQ90_9AGAM|nr:hypothetical protein M407DRAFT_33640 [Tulasnella calospora MUT 4182]
MLPWIDGHLLPIRCLYLGFRAPRHLFAQSRVIATWVVILLRHPLLAARVIASPSDGSPFDTDYFAVRFSYTVPSSPREAIQQASALVEFQKDVSQDEIFDRYFNGKRPQGESRLSCLILTETSSNLERDQAEYSLCMCTPHFIGDSVSGQQLSNEFFTIIAGAESGHVRTTADLEQLAHKQWQA